MTNLVAPSRMLALPGETEGTRDISPLRPTHFVNRNVVASPFAQRGRGGDSNTTSSNPNTNNNINSTNKSSSLLMKPRPRSLSAGRTRHRGSNDLVQNVYDRLGVRRGGDWKDPLQRHLANPSTEPDAHSHAEDTLDPIIGANSMVESEAPLSLTKSMDGPSSSARTSTFHERFRVAATKSRAGVDLNKPRPDATTTEEPQRPRSLSRGRIAQRWPPARQSEEDAAEAEKEAPSSPRPATTTTQYSSSNNNKNRSSANGMSAVGARFSPKRSPLPQKRTTSNGLNQLVLPLDVLDIKEPEAPKVEDTSETEVPSLNSSRSLKDRMRAYSGVVAPGKMPAVAARTNFRGDKQYAAHFAVREHPPKIDIYGRKAEDEKKEEEEGPIPEEEPPKQPLLRTTNTKLGNTSGSLQSETAPSGRRPQTKNASNIANAFLASIQSTSPKPTSYSSKNTKTTTTTSTTAPVAVVAAPLDDHGPGNDAGSVAMSSVSGADEFVPHPTYSRFDINRKPSWQEQQRNRVKPTSSTPAFITTTPSLDAATTKLIDERVAAQVADAETRLGAQMRRFMQQMDDKVLMRLEAMEQKIQNLQGTVAELQAAMTWA